MCKTMLKSQPWKKWPYAAPHLMTKIRSLAAPRVAGPLCTPTHRAEWAFAALLRPTLVLTAGVSQAGRYAALSLSY